MAGKPILSLSLVGFVFGCMQATDYTFQFNRSIQSVSTTSSPALLHPARSLTINKLLIALSLAFGVKSGILNTCSMPHGNRALTIHQNRHRDRCVVVSSANRITVATETGDSLQSRFQRTSSN